VQSNKLGWHNATVPDLAAVHLTGAQCNKIRITLIRITLQTTRGHAIAITHMCRAEGAATAAAQFSCCALLCRS
jgi:hypothetical protein